MTDQKTLDAECASLLTAGLGIFRAEYWGENEYIIICKVGVIGHTMDKHRANWLVGWLNGAIPEAISRLPNV